MKTRFLWLAYCLLAVFSFTSCNDESGIRFLTDEIQGDIVVGKKAVSHVTISNLGGESIFLEGGTMPYQASANNPSLISITIEDNNLYIQATGEEGTTEVTVTDKNGKSATLTVTVQKEILRIEVTDIKTKVSATDGTSMDEATSTTITADITQNSRIQPGNVIALERTGIETLGYKGILRIYSDGSESAKVLYEGTYLQGYYQDLQAAYFEFQYDGATELYFLGRPNLDYPHLPETREIGPVKIYLGRNLTSRYQALYPGVGEVTMAIFGFYY